MTKIYIHPSGGYLLETTTQNYHFTETGAIRTEVTGEGMTEAYPDTTIQATIDNCLATHDEALSGGEIEVLVSFIQHLIETAP